MIFFKTPKLFQNPHVQSILPDIMALTKKSDLSLQTLEAESDKPFVLASKTPKEINNAAVLLFIPGIEGSHASAVIQLLLASKKLAKHPMHVLSHRGIHLEGKHISPYHAGLTSDIALTVKLIKKQHPHQAIHAIAFSMGANLLLNYLAINNHGVDFATAISTPFDLEHCVEHIPQFYQTRILKRIQKRTQNSSTVYDQLDWSRIKTIRDLDEALVAPHFQYDSANHYYQENSCQHRLGNITCPTTLISAADDPFIRPSSWPDFKTLPKNIQAITPTHGGHMGFIDFKRGFSSWIADHLAT